MSRLLTQNMPVRWKTLHHEKAIQFACGHWDVSHSKRVLEGKKNCPRCTSHLVNTHPEISELCMKLAGYEYDPTLMGARPRTEAEAKRLEAQSLERIAIRDRERQRIAAQESSYHKNMYL